MAFLGEGFAWVSWGRVRGEGGRGIGGNFVLGFTFMKFLY